MLKERERPTIEISVYPDVAAQGTLEALGQQHEPRNPMKP